MSEADIKRLIDERSLTRESFTDAQVAGFWNKAAASLAGARSAGLPTESAYQLAYTAALQATLAVLAAHGLRVRSTANHYLTFYALRMLDEALSEPGRRLDGLRQARHQTIYEPDHDEDQLAQRLSGAFERLREALPVFRSAILSIRPGLESSLPVMRI